MVHRSKDFRSDGPLHRPSLRLLAFSCPGNIFHIVRPSTIKLGQLQHSGGGGGNNRPLWNPGIFMAIHLQIVFESYLSHCDV